MRASKAVSIKLTGMEQQVVQKQGMCVFWPECFWDPIINSLRATNVHVWYISFIPKVSLLYMYDLSLLYIYDPFNFLRKCRCRTCTIYCYCTYTIHLTFYESVAIVHVRSIATVHTIYLTYLESVAIVHVWSIATVHIRSI